MSPVGHDCAVQLGHNGTAPVVDARDRLAADAERLMAQMSC